MATESTPDLAHAATQAKSGLPQLDFSTWPSQIFWLLVALGVLYWLLSRIALPRIGGILADRADAISDDIDRAAESKRRAEAAEAAYTAALAAARAEANRIGQEARDAVKRDIAAAIQRADADISARAAVAEARIAGIRDGARTDIETVATETAEAIIASLLPETADTAAVATAVRARLG